MGRKWGWLTAATLAVLLTVTAILSWTVHDAVHNQEDRLLKERANEVALVLKEAVDSLSSQLETVGRVVGVTGGSPSAFRRASAALVKGSDGNITVAQLRRTAIGFRVELAAGPAFRVGDTVDGSLARTFNRATSDGRMVTTPVMGAGDNRTLGLAIGPPVAPDGTVLYLQVRLGTLGPPQGAGTAPFHELNVVLYNGTRPDPSQALVTTTEDLPLRGHVRVVPVPAGAATWTLQVSAVHPLVGSTTANAAWLTLGGGIILSILVAMVVEIETRRRRSALALYRSEHQIAEGLQRSLLPALPAVDGLEIAARYLPGAAEQEVGGDWYDLFELEGGHIGLAVGDVVGHDIDAAVLMSRVQTALRAHAIAGEQPAAVLDRLDHLVRALDTDRLVTVFYGVLGPPEDDGERRLVFANAGHPPPLMHVAGGGVVELDEASSLLLGVPALSDEVRDQHSVPVRPGSTLLLYTDGLVEMPGESLTDLIMDLKLATATCALRETTDEVCDQLLATMRPEALRDDVAMLVVRLSQAAPGRGGAARAGAGRSRRANP
ncbi:MAG TPA: PP2C family protein-serine/threonine phosphatase [Mycobacteriales bacterium]|nr:PP2C family protein-serine/threonine phosphatase [Mycobacteriales bacterium]